MITEEISKNVNVNFFNRSIPQEWCYEHSVIYFFVDHLVALPDNTDVQRVSRMFSRSFLEMGKKIRFVKWDEHICSLIYISIADLENLRKSGGPRLSPKEAIFYSNAMKAGVEVPLHKEQDNWLIVPEIPYMTNHNGLQAIHMILAARLLGLKTAVIFYDATPVLGQKMADTIFKHHEYMRQLRVADVVFSMSESSIRYLVKFFKQEGFDEKDKRIQGWSQANFLPAESFIATHVKDNNRPIKSQPVMKYVGSIKTVGAEFETWEEYSKCLLNVLNRRNGKDSVHSPTMVSIVIPVYNNVELTRQCIESILSQSILANYEIIVVDDASTDSTPEYLKNLGEKVRSVRNNENLRFAGACNAGARIARGNYLLFLNNDTIPESGWLDAMLSRIISDQDIGIVGAKMVYPDRTIQHCGIVFRSGISGFVPVHRLRNTHESDRQVTYPMQFSAVTGACILVRKEIFRRLNGFNDTFKMYFEDIDFCLNVQKIGYIIVYEPLASVVHFERESFTDEIKILMKQSSIIFNYKWKDTIKSLGPLRYGIPYSGVSGNNNSSPDKSLQMFAETRQ